MSYKLFLDDVRDCPSGYSLARSYREAVSKIMLRGMPTEISFDHDLGLEESGYDLAKWIVEYDLNNDGEVLDKNFTFKVHSANPVGKKNIESYLDCYMNHKFNK